ncbi:ABC transporter ATP-binding protein [Streptomyces sp. NPDC048057]|uniref:ABC transporter ATP-binding protein n=1 Tax=Streptomyces sp. NPDC048057 TaxID=3155628 RepID=UPI0033E3D5F8
MPSTSPQPRTPAPTAAHPVELHGLTRQYGTGGGAVTALDGVSLDFARGTLTAVMGPSGSGKSTLLHCAAGLEPPSAGRVVLDGTDLTGLDETGLTLLRRDRIGFVFQTFNLVSALTAEENVALPLRLAGRRPDPTAVAVALAEVGLADRARHRPSTLSGGQQQRVAIARALIGDPAVLFADEPTGALDTKTSWHVLTLLRGLVDERRQTVIMVTHDPVAASFADRVVFLADGRVADETRSRTAATTIAARMATLEAGAAGRPSEVGA